VPNTAYRLKHPTYDFKFPDNSQDPHWFRASAGLSFIEFDDKGKLFSPIEVSAALNEIDKYKAQSTGGDALVVVFIHGWKNNASDDSGNVWGFRRALDEIAALSVDRPVVGIYIGWPGVGFPGQNSGFLEDLSFSNRESVANRVGAGDLRNTLVQIMQRTKGNDYQGKSSCILIGHSFGGLVLESAITPVLEDLIKQSPPGQKILSPADLIVLLNEAAPAGLAVRFLKYLKNENVTYSDDSGTNHPLLLSMTSSGDVATKFAFPGGQFISPSRPANLKKHPPDEFGIDSDLTYWLLTTANTVALQNHEFDSRTPPLPPPDNVYVSVLVGPKLAFDFVRARVPNPIKNDTPYWVSQLPELFVPDHGTVFGCNFMYLLLNLLERGAVLPTGTAKSLDVRSCRVAANTTRVALSEMPAPPVSAPASRPRVWLQRQ
jgi:hypothetical protein